MDIVRPLGGEMQGQHRPHRQAAHHHGVAGRAQPLEGGNDARIPILPSGRQEIGGVAAMARELAAVDGEAVAGEALRDEFQLDRRAAEPVDQQEAGASAADGEAAIDDGHRGLPAMPATRAMS